MCHTRLGHTHQEDGKVKHLTLGNFSDLPDDLIDAMRKRLAGDPRPAEPIQSETEA
jgi:hypothetical protein